MKNFNEALIKDFMEITAKEIEGNKATLLAEFKKKLEDVKTELMQDSDSLEEFKLNFAEQVDKKLKEIKRLNDLALENKVIEVRNHETKVVKVITSAHEKLGTILNVLTARNRSVKNIMMVGPAGSGKTHLAATVSESLDLPYYPMSVGSQTTKSDLMGFVTATGGYQSSPVRKAFETGGVLLLDEFDAAHAGVVTILNSLLSNELVSFPDAIVKKHPDFIVLVACNTYGRGANQQYIGRNRLDAATLDRFLVVDVNYDSKLEEQLVNNKKVTKLVRDLRANSEKLKLEVVISPRASMSLADLVDSGVSMGEALEMVVFKGMAESVKKQLTGGVKW